MGNKEPIPLLLVTFSTMKKVAPDLIDKPHHFTEIRYSL